MLVCPLAPLVYSFLLALFVSLALSGGLGVWKEVVEGGSVLLQLFDLPLLCLTSITSIGTFFKDSSFSTHVLLAVNCYTFDALS